MSLNDGKDAMQGGIYWWPRKFTLDNYAAVFKNTAIFNSFMITIARTLITTTLHVFFTAMVAYAYSKKHLIARNFYLAIGTITLFFSGGLIPTYLLMKDLGLLDNFLIYVFPGMFSFYNLLIITSFYRTLPEAMEESAKIDGANDFIIFIRIILPLCKPVLATIALFVGVANWNDYFTGVIYIRDPQLRPIQTFLYQIIAETNTSSEMMQAMPAEMKATMGITPESVKMATMIVTTAPIVFIYPFLQKYFVKGMMIGSIKG
jgi:putative aldouronate transport system permease protein